MGASLIASTMTKPLRGDAISNLFIGETNWSYCLI